MLEQLLTYVECNTTKHLQLVSGCMEVYNEQEDEIVGSMRLFFLQEGAPATVIFNGDELRISKFGDNETLLRAEYNTETKGWSNISAPGYNLRMSSVIPTLSKIKQIM